MITLENGIKYNLKMEEFLNSQGIRYCPQTVFQLPKDLLSILEKGISEFKDTYIFNANKTNDMEDTDPKSFFDLTDFEHTVNEVIIDSYEETKSFKNLLLASMYFAHQTASILKDFSGKFMVFASIQNDEYVTANARFYKIRDNEAELIPADLDKYQENGIFAIEVNAKD